MPRKRNPKRDQAYRLWIESNKEKKLKDIANEIDASPSTVRKWKSEDNWDEETKRNAPIEKERYDSMRGNKNAKGNSGGKAPPGNKNAVTHGLFAKWLPQETQEIMETLQDRTEADMLWDSIMFQYTAILRSQKIMFVVDQDDTTKEQTQYGFGEAGSDKYEYQYAWDKQATFLSAQSRALSTLSNLIKRFVSMTDEADERRQKLELMKHQIDKTKAEADRIKEDHGDDIEEIVIVDEWTDSDA
ncbi:phage terminase small subunit [Marinilactibacillus sp. Marseille-P9653]|uniref:phage terminase small subunit n=1 Tax=Marinilactibacillus sp. Marseille-P9653 TaxID=2866583 RepID=UPI001CE44846|nr:phage terminase small subunit [Marinilactibacillus sp. Marseille-P9653]